MLEALGVPEDKIVEAVDWYHANQALCELSNLAVTWGQGARTRWRHRAATALYEGDMDKVITLIEELAKVVGDQATDKIPYFRGNIGRMNYPALREEQWP